MKSENKIAKTKKEGKEEIQWNEYSTDAKREEDKQIIVIIICIIRSKPYQTDKRTNVTKQVKKGTKGGKTNGER